MVLHQPVKPYIFNVRATYQREAERAMAHLASIGVRKVAVVHVDDSFGADGLQGARNGLKAAGLEPVAVAKFDRTKPDFAPLLPALQQRSRRPCSSSARATRWWRGSAASRRPVWAGSTSRCPTMPPGLHQAAGETRRRASSSARSCLPA
jgi:hypothetical protein